jgi:hypothetical protein
MVDGYAVLKDNNYSLEDVRALSSPLAAPRTLVP